MTDKTKKGSNIKSLDELRKERNKRVVNQLKSDSDRLRIIEEDLIKVRDVLLELVQAVDVLYKWRSGVRKALKDFINTLKKPK